MLQSARYWELKHIDWIFPVLRRLSNSLILNLSLPFWSRIVYQPTCYFYWRPLCSLSSLLKRTCSLQHVSRLEQHTHFSVQCLTLFCVGSKNRGRICHMMITTFGEMPLICVTASFTWNLKLVLAVTKSRGHELTPCLFVLDKITFCIFVYLVHEAKYKMCVDLASHFPLLPVFMLHAVDIQRDLMGWPMNSTPPLSSFCMSFHAFKAFLVSFNAGSFNGVRILWVLRIKRQRQVS